VYEQHDNYTCHWRQAELLSCGASSCYACYDPCWGFSKQACATNNREHVCSEWSSD
jgi:hypothetical protein